jgi:hypothetical protein
MSQKEFQRVKVIENAVGGRLSVSEAAALLQPSERQVQRRKRRYRPDGVAWVHHGNRGQPMPLGFARGPAADDPGLARGEYHGCQHQDDTQRAKWAKLRAGQKKGCLEPAIIHTGRFPIIFQDAVKLLHQVSKFLGVVFLNNGLSEVLPCFPGVAGHNDSFFTVNVRNTSLRSAYPHCHTNDRRVRMPKPTESQAHRFIMSDSSRLSSSRRPFRKACADLSSAVGWPLLQYRAVVTLRSLSSCLMLLRRSEM